MTDATLDSESGPGPGPGPDLDLDFDGVFDSTARLMSLVTRQLSVQLSRISPPGRSGPASADDRRAA